MKKNNTQVAVNSQTDPGALFGVGNAAATISQSPEASAINGAMALICLSIRAISELRATGRNIRLPPIVEKLVQNPGAALATSGVFNLCAAGAAARNIDPARPETLVEPLILTCFGLANSAWGAASGFAKGSLKQRFLDSSGFIASNTGLFIAAQDTPLALKSAYAVSALMGMYLAVRNKEPHGVIQPYQVNAGTALVASFSAAGNNLALAAANALWCAAYLSLDALKKRGGVFQLFSRTKAAEPASP